MGFYSPHHIICAAESALSAFSEEKAPQSPNPVPRRGTDEWHEALAGLIASLHLLLDEQNEWNGVTGLDAQIAWVQLHHNADELYTTYKNRFAALQKLTVAETASSEGGDAQ